MKKLGFSNTASAVMVGLFFQTGVVHAADANDLIQVAIGGDSPTLTSNFEDWSRTQGAQGPQGPLRTDMMDDTANSQNQPAEPSHNLPENFDN